MNHSSNKHREKHVVELLGVGGWESYFSTVSFQRRSQEANSSQADSLVIQDGRHVSDSVYLCCHILSLRQCITSFIAKPGFDVPEYTQ